MVPMPWQLMPAPKMARVLSAALIAGVRSRAVAEDASVVGGTIARRLQSNSSCWHLPPAVSGNVSDTTSGSIIGFGGRCGGVNYNALTGEDMYLVQIPSNAPGPQGTLTVSTCGGATWDTELIVPAALVEGVCPHNQSEFACGAGQTTISAACRALCLIPFLPIPRRRMWKLACVHGRTPSRL